MTDAQERLIWGHPRDSDGKLIPPRPPAQPMSLDEELRQAAAALASLGATPEQQQEAAEIIKAARRKGG